MEQENNCFKHVFQKNIVQYIKQQHISEATKKEINLKEWMTENLELIRGCLIKKKTHFKQILIRT